MIERARGRLPWRETPDYTLEFITSLRMRGQRPSS